MDAPAFLELLRACLPLYPKDIGRYQVSHVLAVRDTSRNWIPAVILAVESGVRRRGFPIVGVSIHPCLLFASQGYKINYLGWPSRWDEMYAYL